MIVRSINDIYEIAPPLVCGSVSNRSLSEAEMIYFRVRGITITEQEVLDREDALDAHTQRYEPAKRLEEQQRRRYEKVREKLLSIHNYRLPDGREITDFDTLVREGMPEVVKWLFAILTSGEFLSKSERCNFLPPPASLSGAQSTAERSGLAPGAMNEPVPSATAITENI